VLFSVQEFSDRVQMLSGHNQSTGEGVAMAMPGTVFDTDAVNLGREPASAALGAQNFALTLHIGADASG
jgi:hypothetical protein